MKPILIINELPTSSHVGCLQKYKDPIYFGARSLWRERERERLTNAHTTAGGITYESIDVM